MKGFVVYDDATKDKRPGIIMVHEWWGITPHSHSEARKFAQQGYTAFIADMYGDAKTADNPKDSGALAGSVMKDPSSGPIVRIVIHEAPGVPPPRFEIFRSAASDRLTIGRVDASDMMTTTKSGSV